MFKTYILRTTKYFRNQRTHKWEDILYSWIRILNVAKMSIVCEFIYRFSAIPIKIPADFVVEIDKLILKFI